MYEMASCNESNAERAIDGDWRFAKPRAFPDFVAIP
jgi:hypothetical protein